MLRFNYHTLSGKRSSISITETDIKALKFITGKDFVCGKDVKKYINKKLPISRRRINCFSAFIRECILTDLMSIAERAKNE